MKHVLISIFLTITTASYATFIIEPEKTDVGLGEEISISLYSDSGQQETLYLIVEWGYQSILKDPVGYPPLGDLGSITPYTETNFTDSGYEIIISDSSLLPGGLVADFTFVTMDVGDIIVSLYDLYNIDPIDSVTIRESPEPATMSLLAMGGLLIRKRK